MVKAAGDSFAPSIVGAYVYELAKTFNGYYHDHSVWEENPADTPDAVCGWPGRSPHVIHSG